MHRIKKQVAAALALVPLFVLSGCSEREPVYLAGPQTEAQTTDVNGKAAPESESPETETQDGAGYIHVCGAVVSPGVYPVTADMRVFEAIALAGGFSEEADVQWLNQAQTVQDGQRLYVYSKEETRQMSQEEADRAEEAANDMGGTALTPSGKEADDGLVNINTADRETLMTLPGIGEAKAEAVIQYRNEHGNFASIEEIQNISGIKSAVFSKIKDRITV